LLEDLAPLYDCHFESHRRTENCLQSVLPH
jgi:hypothetical protein